MVTVFTLSAFCAGLCVAVGLHKRSVLLLGIGIAVFLNLMFETLFP